MNRKEVLDWFSLDRIWDLHYNINTVIEGPSPSWNCFTHKERKIYQFIYDMNLISKKESQFKKFKNDKLFKDSLFENNYKEDFIEEIYNYHDKKYAEKLKKQKIYYNKRMKALKTSGEEFKKKMKIGDIVIVEKRPMLIIDMYENDFTGRYLKKRRYLKKDYTKTKVFVNKMYKFVTKIDKEAVVK